MAGSGRHAAVKIKVWMGSSMCQSVKGSLYCTNEKCPHKVADKPLNTKAFNHIVGHFTCKISGYFVERKWCGAKRALEYDHTHQILSVAPRPTQLHSGLQTWDIWTNAAEKEYLKGNSEQKPRAPTVKLIDQGSQYYMEHGGISECTKVCF